ncbi:MAG: glycosyltransferase [Adhaeribacter sp.]
MKEKTNIFFVIPSMHGGGSERVFSHILKFINKDKFQASLVLVRKEGVYLNSIPDSVRIYDLNASQTRKVPFKLLKLIWKHKPEVVFSTLGHMNLTIALFKFLMPKSTSFLARESSTVSVHNKNEKFPRLFDFLFSTVYKTFDKIVCQSKYMQEDLVTKYQVPLSKTVIINNPVDFSLIEGHIEPAFSPYEKGKKHFVAVGRLSKEKGFDRLIASFSLLQDKNIHLTIIGDGDDRELLSREIHQLGLEDQISLVGFIKNPYSYMYHAKALLMTSLYEGFPNVVIEANACGTPVIAFHSPGGIGEILVNGSNGWLVRDGDIKAFAEKIREMAYQQPWSRSEIIHLTKSNFAIPFIMDQYERLFAAVSN